MKKTIVAVMVAASAVLSAQAMATNTAQVTVLGEVSDAANSCVVTPTGTLNNGIVQPARYYGSEFSIISDPSQNSRTYDNDSVARNF